MDYSKLRIAYIDSDIITLDNILWGLIELGVDAVRPDFKVSLNYPVEEQIELVRKAVPGFDYVITQNFSVNVAIGCHEAGVRYISWIYDSPQVALYTEYALYDENYVFAFDRTQCERLKKEGLKHVFYMPLAANMAYSGMINITDADIKNYACDISFVGQLYRLSYYEKIHDKLDDEVHSEINDICAQKALKWGAGISIFESFSPETVEKIARIMKQSDFEYFSTEKQFSEEVLLLAPRIATIERCELLKASGELGKCELFTKDEDVSFAQSIKGIRANGPIKGEDVYKNYFSSKLNLNVTLRSIETGAAQRIFDIMSVGGTVISNYQEELASLFEPDKEIILFESIDEYKDKVKYYLSHNKERTQIGARGYMRVRDEYNYPTALKKIFELSK